MAEKAMGLGMATEALCQQRVNSPLGKRPRDGLYDTILHVIRDVGIDRQGHPNVFVSQHLLGGRGVDAARR